MGNNNGQRGFVQIHTVPKQNDKKSNDVETFKIFYVNNTLETSQYLNHDFDAETLVNVDDSLFFFLKVGILAAYLCTN